MFLPIRDHNSRLTGHDVSGSVECPDWSNVRFPFVFGFRCVATGIDSTDLFLFPSLVSTDSIPLADGQKQIKLMTKTIILMKPEILPRTYCYLSLSLSFYLFIFIHFSPFSSYFLVFFFVCSPNELPTQHDPYPRLVPSPSPSSCKLEASRGMQGHCNESRK